MMDKEIMEQIKKKIENVRDLINMQDGEPVYDCNFRELDEAIALLESAKTEPVCPNCGLKGKQATLPHTCRKAEPVRQDNGEFIERAKVLRRKGATTEQWEFATMLGEACRRLDARQKEIERLTAENAQKSVALSNLKSSNRALFAEKQAQDEQIGKYKQVMQRCIEAMKGSNCFEQQWLEQALQPKEGEKPCENIRLKELLSRHRICVKCGKQLVRYESMSVHTCQEEKDGE